MTSRETDEKLRSAFKQMNRFMILMWRWGWGPLINACPPVTGRILVVGQTGRKSGVRRLTPLNYVDVGDDIYIMAGFGSAADWYRNILAHPKVEIWLKDGWWEGEAADANDSEQRLQLVRALMVASGIVAPLMGLDPRRMSDAELAAATQEYRLVCLRRTAARTGPGGPGELSWIWPLAVFGLLGWLLFRPYRCTKRSAVGD